MPAEPWRLPSGAEAARLSLPTPPAVDEPFVALASIPSIFVGRLRKYLVRGQALWPNQSAVAAAAAPLISYLSRRYHCPEPIIHGVAVHAAALTTATWDRDLGGFLGLHVDHWDGLPLEGRHRSLIRVSVNIGWTPRYFLFLNLSLVEMRDLILRYRHRFRHGNFGAASVGSAFMLQFGDYPIVRLRVEPGEAYIAPTDNLIHDASTQDGEGPSYSFVLRGRFHF